MPLEFARIGPTVRIAEGGAGTVHRIPSFTLPGWKAGTLAYKNVHQPRPNFTLQNRAEALRSMEKAVALRAGMAPADQDALDEYTAWPLDTVEEKGATVGIIMPLLADEFFIDAQPVGAKPSRRVFEFSYLSASDNFMKNNGMDRTAMNDPLVRLSLNAQLAYALGLLHRQGIVYGDLSLKNVAVAANPPRIKLLDCDAAASETDPSRKQMHSPGFAPPEYTSGAQKSQDSRTDVYKLGLCILRSLVTGPGVTQLTDASKLKSGNTVDPAGADLVARAVSDVRADRPTAPELCQALVRTVQSRVRPPQIHAASIDRVALLRGTDVAVSWVADGATRLRILGPNGFVVDVTRYGGAAGYTVTPPASGDLVIEATNRHGVEEVVAGHVSLYDLPALHLPSLPRPAVPAVPAVQMPSAMAAISPRPSVSVAAHPVPRLDAPDMSGLLAGIGPVLPGDAFLAPGRRTAQRMQAVHQEASAEIADLISQTLATATASVRRANTTTSRGKRP